jgi:hypothetical protein
VVVGVSPRGVAKELLTELGKAAATEIGTKVGEAIGRRIAKRLKRRRPAKEDS